MPLFYGHREAPPLPEAVRILWALDIVTQNPKIQQLKDPENIIEAINKVFHKLESKIEKLQRRCKTLERQPGPVSNDLYEPQRKLSYSKEHRKKLKRNVNDGRNSQINNGFQTIIGGTCIDSDEVDSPNVLHASKDTSYLNGTSDRGLLEDQSSISDFEIADNELDSQQIEQDLIVTKDDAKTTLRKRGRSEATEGDSSALDDVENEDNFPTKLRKIRHGSSKQNNGKICNTKPVRKAARQQICDNVAARPQKALHSASVKSFESHNHVFERRKTTAEPRQYNSNTSQLCRTFLPLPLPDFHAGNTITPTQSKTGAGGSENSLARQCGPRSENGRDASPAQEVAGTAPSSHGATGPASVNDNRHSEKKKDERHGAYKTGFKDFPETGKDHQESKREDTSRTYLSHLDEETLQVNRIPVAVTETGSPIRPASHLPYAAYTRSALSHLNPRLHLSNVADAGPDQHSTDPELDASNKAAAHGSEPADILPGYNPDFEIFDEEASIQPQALSGPSSQLDVHNHQHRNVDRAFGDVLYEQRVETPGSDAASLPDPAYDAAAVIRDGDSNPVAEPYTPPDHILPDFLMMHSGETVEGDELHPILVEDSSDLGWDSEEGSSGITDVDTD